MAPDVGMPLMVRTPPTPEPLVDALRSAVHSVNPTLAVFNVRTMTQVVSDSLWELHLYRWLISLFASVALTLAALGLYGVMSYNVASRMKEFAVRLALGSEPGRVARLVVANGLRLAAVGLGIGVLAALALTPPLRSLSPALAGDTVMYVAVGAALLALALAVSVIPAVRVAA